MTTILVTGATGTIGSQLITQLGNQADLRLRVATRDASKVARLPTGVETVDFDWQRPDLVERAVAGVDTVFLLTPFVDTAVAYTQTLVDAAKRAGVRKIVKISAAGAQQEAFELARWHRTAERLVEGSGLRWVTLRPNFFMTNFLHFYPPDAEGAIYLPTGTGKAAWVDPIDVAAVAAAALTRGDWDGQALDITGPEALSVAEVAERLSQVTGRKILHVDVPAAAARSAMEAMKLPAWMVQGMMDLHGVLQHSWAAGLSDVVERITGRAPRTFAAFAREYATALSRQSPAA